MFEQHKDPAAREILSALREENRSLILEFAKSADILQARSESNMTLLHSAICEEKRQAVAALLEAGANPNAIGGPAYYTALHFAAYRNDAETAQLLIRHGADVNYCAPAANTALHLAVYMGAKDVAYILLKAGADPKAGNCVIELARQRMDDIPSHRDLYADILQMVSLWGSDHSEKVERDLQALRSLKPARYRLGPGRQER